MSMVPLMTSSAIRVLASMSALLRIEPATLGLEVSPERLRLVATI